MTSRGEMNVPLIAAGVVAIAVALVFGLQTPDGGPDWVGIVTSIAGLVMIVAGLIPRFRSGAPHIG
jgi:peptidoglycan/LPS O-acetylase OafA/YrhL